MQRELKLSLLLQFSCCNFAALLTRLHTTNATSLRVYQLKTNKCLKSFSQHNLDKALDFACKLRMNKFLQQPRNKLLQSKEKAVADAFSKCKIKPKNTALFRTENVNQNHNVKLNHKAKTFNIKQAKNITGTDASWKLSCKWFGYLQQNKDGNFIQPFFIQTPAFQIQIMKYIKDPHKH